MSDKHKDALPSNDEVYAEVFTARGNASQYVSTNAVNDTMAAVRSILARRASQVSAAAPAERFFMDHGMWHDRETGQHMYTEDEFYEKYRDGLAIGKQNAEIAAESVRASEGQAQTSLPEVVAAASALLDCLDGLPVDTDEATAAALTAFDRTRSLLKKAIAGQAQTSAAVATWEERVAGDKDYSERTAMLDEIAVYRARAAQLADSTGGVKS